MCVPSKDICYVDASASAPGKGTIEAPHHAIADCLGSATIAVAEGTYRESLSFSSTATLIGYQSPAELGMPRSPDAPKVVIESPIGTISVLTSVSIVGVKINNTQLVVGANASLKLYASVVSGSFVGSSCLLVDKGALELRDVLISGCSANGVDQQGGQLDLDGLTVTSTGGVGVRVQQAKLDGRRLEIWGCEAGLEAWGSQVMLDGAHAWHNRRTGLEFRDHEKVPSTGKVLNVSAHDNKRQGIHISASGFVLGMVTLTGNNWDEKARALGVEGMQLACDPAGTTVVNSIVWPKKTPQSTSYIGKCTFSYSDVYAKAGAVVAGDGNINAVPLFDSTSSSGLELSAASPCIDAGADSHPAGSKPKNDLLGAPRFVKLKAGADSVDMGAYERQSL